MEVSFKADLEWKQDPDFLWCVDVSASVSNGVVGKLVITGLRTLFVHYGSLSTYFVDTTNHDNTAAVAWLNQKLEIRGDWLTQLSQRALGACRGTVART